MKTLISAEQKPEFIKLLWIVGAFLPCIWVWITISFMSPDQDLHTPWTLIRQLWLLTLPIIFMVGAVVKKTRKGTFIIFIAYTFLFFFTGQNIGLNKKNYQNLWQGKALIPSK